MKIIFAFLLATAPSLLTAQKRNVSKTFAETITAQDLKKHLYIVAGEEMEGRGTATEGERRAAAYIENHFRTLGLTPGNNGSYLMPFPLYLDSVANAVIEVNGKSYAWNKDFSLADGSFGATMLFSEVMYLGSAAPDSASVPNIKGKLVIVSGSPSIQYAYEKGAAAILIASADFQPGSGENRANLGRQAFRQAMGPLSFIISTELANAITGNGYTSAQDSIKSGTFKPAVYNSEIKLELNKQTSRIFSNNVVGCIEGTDKKDEYLFITAHYDHLGKGPDSVIYYGADDDGSGTVSLLEMAEAFAKAKAAGKGPRRTIVFMTVSGEEKGLWGSEYYSNHPLFPLEKTTADINIDMVGRIDPDYKGDSLNYIYSIGDNKLSSELPIILDGVNKKYSRMEIDRKFNDPEDPNRFYYRSDHYNFAKKGVPIIFFFNGVHADYHRPTDTVEKINYALQEKRVRLIFHTAWEIANKDQLLKRDKPL